VQNLAFPIDTALASNSAVNCVATHTCDGDVIVCCEGSAAASFMPAVSLVNMFTTHWLFDVCVRSVEVVARGWCGTWKALLLLLPGPV